MGMLRSKSDTEREGLCDRLYRPCLCSQYFLKRVSSRTSGSKGAITVLAYALLRYLMPFPHFPTRNQVLKGSLLNAWSKIACWVAPDLCVLDDGLWGWRHLYLRALEAAHENEPRPLCLVILV